MAFARMTNRREHLRDLGLLALLLGVPSRASARSVYGGRVRLSLPFRSDALDPSDPFDPLAALLGGSMFSPLYGYQPGTGAYPTLAEALPAARGGGLAVTLRPRMTFASGAPLDAASVVASLRRARKNLRGALDLPEPKVLDERTLEFPGTDGGALARLLAEPLLGIVPANFDPAKPDASGALRFLRRTSEGIFLARNARSPRGGAFLDEVELRMRAPEDCLRDFELGQSSVGYLGLGLHHDRNGARAFSLPGIGLMVLRGSSALGSFGKSGALHAALSTLDGERLRAHGIAPWGNRSSGAAPTGPSLGTALFSENHPLFVALARTLATDLGATEAASLTREGLRNEVTRREKGLLLTFLRTPDFVADPNEYIARLLSAVDRGGDQPSHAFSEQPEKLARRLFTGMVGTLVPSGGLDGNFRTSTEATPFDLGNASLFTQKTGI